MFLNPLMLAGLGGAVLPLVLHLLNRARYRTMDWGAMMFLPNAGGRQQQSTRIKQLLLLLLRMSIVSCIALAMARPLVGKGWAALGADPHCCAVIVIDTSASMGVENAQGTRLDAARRSALAVMAGLERSDEVNVITIPDADAIAAPLAHASAPADFQSAVARIADMHLQPERADIASALAASARIFEQSAAANRLIVLICDRQAASWKNVTDEFATFWRASVVGKGLPPRIVLIAVGGEESESVAIEKLSPPPAPQVRDMVVPIDVEVHNYGQLPVNGLPLILSTSSGRLLQQATVDIAPHAVTTLTLNPRLNNLGSHVITAKLGSSSSTPLSLSDQADAVVTVGEPPKVLLISGDSPTATVRTEADYIRMALAPYKTAGQSGADLAEVTLISPTDPWPAELSPFRAIILANVPRLDATHSRIIEQFVFDGGGLLVAPGELTRPAEYNQALYNGGAGVLPAELAQAVDLPASSSEAAGGSNIAPDINHPVFRFLQGRSELTADLGVGRYLRAKVASSDTRVLATYRNGDPAVIEREFGRGRSMLVTTTLGTEWSALPRSSFFLPFVQSSIRFVCGGAFDTQNLAPGQPIVARFTEALGDRGMVILPDGSHEPVDITHVGSFQEVRFSATQKTGKYEVRVRTPRGDTSEPFIVQGPKDEADLTPLTPQRWEQLEKLLGFTRIDPQSTDLASATAGRRGGREMWLTLIAMSVALMVTESALSRLWSVEA